MINHESKILELITRNGPLKVRDLCKLMGLHETSVKRFIKPLFNKGMLKRASDWSYSINSDPLPVESDKYSRMARQAAELESKGFWLRAAQVWREAMLVARFDTSWVVKLTVWRSWSPAVRAALCCRWNVQPPISASLTKG